MLSLRHHDGTCVCASTGLPIIGLAYPRLHPSSASEWFLYGFGTPSSALTGVYTAAPASMPVCTIAFGVAALPARYSASSSESVSVSGSSSSRAITAVGLGGLVFCSSFSLSSAFVGGLGPSGPSAGPSGSFLRHTKTHRSPPPAVTSHLSEALNAHDVTRALCPR